MTARAREPSSSFPSGVKAQWLAGIHGATCVWLPSHYCRCMGSWRCGNAWTGSWEMRRMTVCSSDVVLGFLLFVALRCSEDVS